MSTPTKPKLTIIDGHAYCTSLDVATHFNKRHDDVLKAIRNKMSQCSEGFNLRNFAEISATDRRNRVQPAFRLTRDGFAIIAMSFTGREATAWQEAYIAAFNAMEAELRRRSAEAGVIRRAEAQLTLFPAFNAALAEQRPAMRLSVAAIQIEAKRVMLPSPKASDLRRLIARGALEGFREPSGGRWMVYEDSLAQWLELRKFNAA
jgi:Rha family phage regulatory protein